MTFGEYLLSAMRAAGFPSNASLARASGITESSISKWRNDLETPKHPMLRQLAPILGVPMRELVVAAGYMTWEEAGLDAAPKPPEPVDVDALLAKSELSEADRKTVADELQRLRALNVGIERLKRRKDDGDNPDRRRA